jgi:aryl-alcohol dehydrogenase-like predicted oxidoreductase
MQRRALGRTGLQVSRLGLGTMTWGRDTDEHEAREQLALFMAAGGTLVDTADMYADGLSEQVVGQLLAEVADRDEVVLATKAVMRPQSERRFDASRRHLLGALERSLRRLQVDHVDLWQLHVWDAQTPLDETLAAVDDAVRSGKVRYAGVSNYAGWQLARAATWQAAVPGRAAISSVQAEYSLLQRGIEREVLPAALDLGIGVLPWSPLGRGVLTGKYRHGIPADSRAATSHFGAFAAEFLTDAKRRIVDAVCTAADGLGASPLEVGLAWVRDRPGVTAPIVGARTAVQLRGVLAADDLVLPDEIVVALDDVSDPGLGYPEAGWNQRPR